MRNAVRKANAWKHAKTRLILLANSLIIHADLTLSSSSTVFGFHHLQELKTPNATSRYEQIRTNELIISKVISQQVGDLLTFLTKTIFQFMKLIQMILNLLSLSEKWFQNLVLLVSFPNAKPSKTLSRSAYRVQMFSCVWKPDETRSLTHFWNSTSSKLILTTRNPLKNIPKSSTWFSVSRYATRRCVIKVLMSSDAW